MPATINRLIKNHAIKTRDFIIGLLFPIECASCGEYGRWLCPQCFKTLKFNDHFECLFCKNPTLAGQFCDSCADQFALSGVWIAGQYNFPLLKKLIKNYKYNFVSELAQPLGKFLSLYFINLKNSLLLSALPESTNLSADKLNKILKAPPTILELTQALIMPVPLYKKRLRWRGYNQAALLARFFSRSFGLDYDEKSLIRLKYNKPQAKLNRRQRIINVKNNFSWQGRGLKNRNIILIDDVSTTGATLNECAKALKKAGANEIWGLVLAHG